MTKKLTAVILSIIMILNLSPLTAMAEVDDYFVRYSGSTTASYGYKPNCTFTVDEIVGNKFRGGFSASNLGSYSFDESVEGKVYSSDYNFSCVFTVKFFNDRYYSNMCITVYPYEGYCECFCVGSWHMEDFKMTGTKLSLSGASPSVASPMYDEDDMKLCMAFSNAAYDDNYAGKTPKAIIDIANENDFTNNKKYIVSNEHKNRYEKDKISYTILPKFSEVSEQVDLYIILRGTTNDE